MKDLFVFKKTKLAGRLFRTKNGAQFEYTNEDTENVAITLSKDSKVHQVQGDNLHPFFAGLLPEGRRLEALLQSSKTSADDMFTLLSQLEGDFIGDVSVSKTDELVNQQPFEVEELDFKRLFNQSIANRDMGVSGVQPKLSADRLTLPLKKRDKGYLLKLGSSKYPQLVQNEHFFMTLAGSCGIETAKTEIVFDKNNQPGLLVERFDRKASNRLWCEDICQVLGRYPADKYNLSTREALEAIADNTATPLIQTLKAIEIFLFSYLIGNGDLHAKNLSLLKRNKFFELAPAYDLLSTLPYNDQFMALHIEGRKKNLQLSNFYTLGERKGITKKAISSRAAKIVEEISISLEYIGEIDFEKKLTTNLKSEIEKRLIIFDSQL